MKFIVLSPRSSLFGVNIPAFVIRQDRWDDFGFKTQYHLHYIDSERNETYIGELKILQLNQVGTNESIINSNFERLDERYCSLGQSLDYYERLSVLGKETRDEVLACLNDIIFRPEIRDKFRNEPGWTTSLFRGLNENDDFIKLAGSLVSQDYTNLAAEDLSFSFKPKGWSEYIDFSFSLPEIVNEWGRQPVASLPGRIVVLIGRNGCGKSTLLARMARVMYGSKQSRQEVLQESAGSIVPDGIGFPRIITVSYSAFDSFQLPGIDRVERVQIAKDIKKGEGRFIFCGLRDITKEIEDDSLCLDGKCDKAEKTYLKSIDKLAEEFARTIRIIDDKNRWLVLRRIVKILQNDASFGSLGSLIINNIFDDPEKLFLSLSTGLKISLQIISELIAYASPRSIVLIDEPETHIHPPLLAVLIQAIREILEEYKSFAVIATHSPVVLQETMSRHVKIIRSEGDFVVVKTPDFETFGENISALTSEAFGLNTNTTDYHKKLSDLVSMYSLEEIESFFGDKGLSMQGRAYVMSLESRKAGD